MLTAPQCPLCGAHTQRYVQGSVTDTDYFRRRGYTIAAGDRETLDLYRCVACGHGFSPLTVPPETIASWYAANEPDTAYVAAETARRRTARRVLTRLERLRSPGRLLDIGAGPGFFVAEALARGWQAEGLEPDQWAVAEAARRGTPITQGTDQDLSSLPPASFDVVTFFDVIEHVVDPIELVRRVHHVVRPGGWVVLTTPRFDSAVARLMNTHWYAIFPAHLHYFSRLSLTRTLSTAGFTPRQWRAHVRDIPVGHNWERLLGMCGVSRPQRLALPRLVSDRAVPVALGDEFEVYAQRV